MPEVIYRRCLHVVQEDDRVVETVQRLRAGDLNSVGRLMAESHASLRDLYEVSCAELDVMVEAAQGLPGFIGGRMTGGGFGGCTVNLVEEKHASRFAEEVTQRYREKTGILAMEYVCSAADGAGAE
jgi:galactokinase